MRRQASVRDRWIGFFLAGIAVAVVAGVALFAGLLYPVEAAAGIPVAMLTGWALAPLAVRPGRALAAIVRVAAAATAMAWIAAGVVLFLGGGTVLLLILLWTIRLASVGDAVREVLPGTVEVFLSIAGRIAVLSTPTAVVWVVLMRALSQGDAVAPPIATGTGVGQ